MRRIAMLGLLLAVTPIAAEPSPSSDVTAHDRTIIDVLRNVHNKGADLYNAGDAVGCYRLFQGALLTVEPLLTHRPEVRQLIREGLTTIEKEPDPKKRAFPLHKLIEDVRAKLKQEAARPVVSTPKPEVLHEGRLGRVVVGQIVDDFFERAGQDHRVNLSRGGKYAADSPVFAQGRSYLADFLLRATGAKITFQPEYEPKILARLKAAQITEAEYSAAINHLQAALKKHGATAIDIQNVLNDVTARKGLFVSDETIKPSKVSLRLRGSLRDAVDHPLANVAVSLIGGAQVGFVIVEAKTDPNGQFTVAVRPGEYHVVAVGPNVPSLYHLTQSTPWRITIHGDTTDLTLKLQP